MSGRGAVKHIDVSRQILEAVQIGLRIAATRRE